jgi:gamma-glutamyltranspeptidase/glutathione hydrolase
MPVSAVSLVRVAAMLAATLTACATSEEPPRLPRVLPAVSVPPAAQAHREGVVAVANPHGAEAGARILEQGGNAVDAAVAIAYALNVVEPESAGIGGGGFMLVHLAESGRTFVIDSREKAPARATADLFVGVPSPSLQGVAVGVPGMVRGTAHAIDNYGRLPLSAVLQPAIALADDGFAATPRYVSGSCGTRAQNSPEAAAYFCRGGAAPAVGSLVRNPPLAGTLRLIAEHGPDCFYVYMPEKGCDIARGVVEGQKFVRPGSPPGAAGSMDYSDLENYRVAERVPLEGSYRGYRIQTMSPPSSGGLAMLQMMKMLERFPIGDDGQGFGFGSLRTVNVMAEAMRLAFADRSIWMGDADFAPVPVKGLLHPAYVGRRSALIVPGARMDPNPAPDDPRPYEFAGIEPARRLPVAEPVTGPGETTTHFSVVDPWGNVVSYTNTIESSHGIGVFAGYEQPDGSFRSHGFLLNNELTDFNTAPSVNPFTGEAGYNDVQPNKRPRSSMTPTLIFSSDGKPLVALGSPGGSTIINSVFNVALNLIDHRMTIQQAIDAPRVSVTDAASAVSLEAGFPQQTVSGLAALGYSVSHSTIGSVQAVVVDPSTGRQYGGADARRDGTVIGLPRRPAQ